MNETITLSDALIEKAERLLLERRLHIAMPGGPLVALVDGDHGTYEIRRNATLYCTCSARGICAHLLSLAYVTEGREAEVEDTGLPAALHRLEDRRARQERAVAWQEWE